MTAPSASALPGADAALASQGRRLAGAVIDAVLFVVTLVIGWLIWFAFVGRRGQSPGKQLLGMQVVREDGTVAGLGVMALRDVVLKSVLFWVVNQALILALDDIGGLIAVALFGLAALWCVWDAQRQCLWDKVVKTRVLHGDAVAAAGQTVTPGAASGGGAVEAAENLQTLSDLHARGLLTDEEYEERRAREMERL